MHVYIIHSDLENRGNDLSRTLRFKYREHSRTHLKMNILAVIELACKNSYGLKRTAIKKLTHCIRSTETLLEFYALGFLDNLISEAIIAFQQFLIIR